jgi:hypothetical protein
MFLKLLVSGPISKRRIGTGFVIGTGFSVFLRTETELKSRSHFPTGIKRISLGKKQK